MGLLGIRLAEADDMVAVCEIVNFFIRETVINYRTAPQPVDEWVDAWRAGSERYPWLVAIDGNAVVGIAYAGPWNGRAAYDWSAEVTVYVDHGVARRGIGRALYQRLFELLDDQGFYSQVAVIGLPNDPSVALHEKFGFRHTGTLRDIGYKSGRWHDIGLWQRSVEPRKLSPNAPIPVIEADSPRRQ